MLCAASQSSFIFSMENDTISEFSDTEKTITYEIENKKDKIIINQSIEDKYLYKDNLKLKEQELYESKKMEYFNKSVIFCCGVVIYNILYSPLCQKKE